MRFLGDLILCEAKCQLVISVCCFPPADVELIMNNCCPAGVER